ncbi:53_t:CDS:2, partial [Dentiscutata erythropus]
PVDRLPVPLQAVLEPVTSNAPRQPYSKTKVIASAAIISLAAYITNYIYRRRLENFGSQTISPLSGTSSKFDVFEGPTPGNNKYTLTVPYKNRTAKVTIRPTSTETFKKHKKFFPPVTSAQRVGVNKVFFKQLSAIFKVIIPKIRSKEVIILVLHSIFLVLRTWLSIVVAKLDGRIVRDLVAANGKEFLKGIMYWFAIAIPATYTNSM